MELEIASKVGDLEIDATPDTDGDTAVPDFRNDQQISRVQLPSVERMSKATGSSSEGAVDLMLADHDAGLGAGVAVKKEAKPEEDQAGFDGAYDCLMCFTSCRGQPALHCTACTWNPWHVACAAGTQFERVCPQCGQESVAPWKRGKFTTLQQSGECVDLVAEEEAAEERQREREREESVRKRELEERQRELEREEARKRELERAREEEKERARAREDATRREQERVDSAAGCTFDKGFQEARAQAARQVYARQEPHGYQAGKEDAEEEEAEEAEELTNKLGHRAGGPACAALGGTKRAAPAASAGGSGSSKRRRRREADTAEAGVATNTPPSLCPHQQQRSLGKESAKEGKAMEDKGKGKAEEGQDTYGEGGSSGRGGGRGETTCQHRGASAESAGARVKRQEGRGGDGRSRRRREGRRGPERRSREQNVRITVRGANARNAGAPASASTTE